MSSAASTRTARLSVAVLAVAVGALLVAVGSGHLAVARVVTGSMAPALPVGSLVVGLAVSPGDVRVGDVVTVPVPSLGGTVTHRVVSVSSDDGRTVVRTRGDANRDVDAWVTSLPGPAVTRVVGSAPLVGALLSRGAHGLPLLTVPLLVLLVTWSGSAWLLRVLRSGP